MKMKPQTGCAQRLEEVLAAWRLVYRRYLDMGLVDENPFGIHTVPQAVGDNVCVVNQVLRGEVTSTVTVIPDSANKLPLDSVYGGLLDDFRSQGRAMAEVGLMADRRSDNRRAASALFEIMCWAGYYTLHLNYTDILVGVHPRHASFYQCCFGFEVVGEQKEYPSVNHNPVVLLWLPVRHIFEQSSVPAGFEYAHKHPITAENFSQLFTFDWQALQGSLIERFLG